MGPLTDSYEPRGGHTSGVPSSGQFSSASSVGDISGGGSTGANPLVTGTVNYFTVN